MANPYAQPIDNLSAFTHPTFKQKFRYMNDEEGIALARTMLHKFIETGYDNVVVIESGTSPLIHIITQLEEFQQSGINFVQLKIPRDQTFSLNGWFRQYLTAEEMNAHVNMEGASCTRDAALQSACKKFSLAEFVGTDAYTIMDSISDVRDYHLADVAMFHEILKGTHLAAIMSEPFLLFDEYINSGTVLRNFNAMARLFTQSPNYRLSAYCMFVDNARQYNKIAFSLYDNATELDCYQHGAYPYENRVDLIGYYFFIDGEHFEKITLRDEVTNLRTSMQTPDVFHDEMMRAIDGSNVTSSIMRSLNEVQVREYVTHFDVARYLMKQLEIMSKGIGKYSDLLDQVFEIYAPAWSPMPVKNHLDYWHGFAAAEPELDLLARELVDSYTHYRQAILTDVLQKLLENKSVWDNKIRTLLKGGNV